MTTKPLELPALETPPPSTRVTIRGVTRTGRRFALPAPCAGPPAPWDWSSCGS